MPDLMAAMIDQKKGQSGATCLGPVTHGRHLHAMHYHAINVFDVQMNSAAPARV